MKGKLYSVMVLLAAVILIAPPNGFAQNEIAPEYVVRVIYFLSNDRSPEQNIDAKLDTLIKRVQQFYVDEMERHGFGRKTFQIETDTRGNVVVHHVNGKFNSSHYVGDKSVYSANNTVIPEINEQFDRAKNIDFVVVDIGFAMGGISGGGSSHNGYALITTNGDCDDTGEDFFILSAHELGHVFGLAHDFRGGGYILSYGPRPVVQLSECAAEWLDVHRYFNTPQTSIDTPTIIEMLPPLAYLSNAIRLRFEVSDADGLHQAQLVIPFLNRFGDHTPSLIACKRLNGKNNTVEFVTTELTPGPDSYAVLKVIDVHGNYTAQSYPIRQEDIRVNVNNRADINGDGVINVADRVPATLRKISGDNQYGVSHKQLTKPFVVEVLDTDGKPVVGVEVVFRINLDPAHASGALSVTNPRTDANGRAQSFLIPVYSPYDHYGTKVVVSVAGVSGAVTFNASEKPKMLVDQSERPLMYWIGDDRSTLYGTLPDDRDHVIVFSNSATSVAFDGSSGGKLYWAERWNPWEEDAEHFCGAIRCSSPDFSPEVLATLTSLPLGIAIDATRDKLYWTTSLGNIQRANIDGSNIQTLITNLDSPQDIAVDTVRGKLYWTERQGRIQRADLNGKNIQTVVTSLGTLGHITLTGSNLYWTEKISDALGKINRADLDGSNVEDIITLSRVPVGLAIDIAGNKLYWTEIGGHIRRANLDGSNVEDIVAGLVAPSQLVLNIPPTLTDTLNTLKGDVNGDGIINVQDLVLVASNLGQSGPNDADVNKDGIVNIVDLVLVAGALEDTAAAPAIYDAPKVLFTAQEVRHWLIEAKLSGENSPVYRRGVLMLERLLMVLVPKETALLSNYPNPFNPETWIPYQLAKPADVTLHIYTTNGALIRTLALGHQPAGMYHNKDRAAYWDGRNTVGEPVASGGYFYTLTAGDFTATRQMIIVK